MVGQALEWTMVAANGMAAKAISSKTATIIMLIQLTEINLSIIWLTSTWQAQFKFNSPTSPPSRSQIRTKTATIITTMVINNRITSSITNNSNTATKTVLEDRINKIKIIKQASNSLQQLTTISMYKYRLTLTRSCLIRNKLNSMPLSNSSRIRISGNIIIIIITIIMDIEYSWVIDENITLTLIVNFRKESDQQSVLKVYIITPLFYFFGNCYPLFKFVL